MYVCTFIYEVCFITQYNAYVVWHTDQVYTGLIVFLSIVIILSIAVGIFAFIYLIFSIVIIKRYIAKIEKENLQLDARGHILKSTIKFNTFLGFVHACIAPLQTLIIMFLIYGVDDKGEPRILGCIV